MNKITAMGARWGSRLAIAAVLCIGISACRDAFAATMSSDATRAGKASLYSGESIFLGVTVGKGSVGARLGTPNANSWNALNARLSEADRVRLSASVDSVVGRMRHADPAFFNRFAVEMQSGNALRVMAAMTDARELLGKVTKPTGNAPAHVDDSQTGCLLLVLAVGVVVINVAVVLNFDIAANFVTSANIVSESNVVWGWGPPPPFVGSIKPALEQDEFVALVTERLATR